MGYAFTAEWVKGTRNNAPGALSRSPVSDPEPEELLAEGLASPAEVRALTSIGLHVSLQLTDLHHLAEQDDNLNTTLKLGSLRSVTSCLQGVRDTGMSGTS